MTDREAIYRERFEREKKDEARAAYAQAVYLGSMSRTWSRHDQKAHDIADRYPDIAEDYWRNQR